MKLNTKIIFFVLEISLIPLIFLGYVIYSNNVAQIEQSYPAELRAVAKIQHNRLEDLMNEKMDLLNVFLTKPLLRSYLKDYVNHPTPKLQDEMNNNLVETRASSTIVDIFLTNPEGLVVASTDKSLIGTDVSTKNFFIKGITENNLSYLSKNINGSLSQYLVGPEIIDGKTMGVLAIIDNGNDITNIVNDYTGLGETGETLLVRDDGNGDAVFLTNIRFDKNASLTRVTPKIKNTPANHAIAKETNTFLNLLDYRDVPVFAATNYVESVGWGIVTKIDIAEILLPINKLRDLYFYIVLAALVLIIIITVPISNSIAKNEEYLKNEVQKNIASLMEAQRIAKLGSWELDLVDNKLVWSNEIFDIFEIDKEKFTATHEAFLEGIHPEDRDIVNIAYTNSLKTRKPYSIDHRLLMKDGRIKFVQEQCNTVYDEDGKPLRSVGTVQDITERKLAEEKLRESEEVQSLYIKNSPIYTYIKEVTPEESRVLKASENFKDMVGIPGSKMIGKTMSELYPAEFAAKMTQDDWNVVASGKTLELDEEFNGHYYITVKFPIVIGKRKLLAGYTLDITDRKKAETSLAITEKRYRDLFQNMINGFAYHKIITDENNKPVDYEFLEINPIFEKMTGLGKNIIGKKATEIIPDIEKDPANWIGLYGNIALTGNEMIFENYSEGLKKWFRISAYSPNKGYFATLFEDITEQKQAEIKLNEYNFQFKKLTKNMPGMIYQFLIKPDGTYAVPIATDGIKDMYGCSPDDVKNNFSPIAKVILPEDLDSFITSIKESAKKLTAWKHEYRVQIPGHPIKWLLGQSSPEKLPNNDIVWYGFNTDITEEKQTEEKLKELDKLKDEFLSITTHELKTPLIPIKSQAQILLAGDYGKLNKEQKAAIEMIYRNEESLNMLTGEVLEIAKIKSNKLNLIREKTDFSELINSSINDFKIQANEKKLRIALAPLPDIPETIIDQLKITEVINNLLNNALKFTPENGEISIKVENENDNIKVTIKDSGIGIDSKNINKLFTPFFQIDSSLSRKYRGTGLGLAICKGIIEAHGGKIWVESDGEDKGSAFIFTLPIKHKIN